MFHAFGVWFSPTFLFSTLLCALCFSSPSPSFQIGQRHGGVLGKFQDLLSHCAGHIWFERSESKDRALITGRYTQATSPAQEVGGTLDSLKSDSALLFLSYHLSFMSVCLSVFLDV